MSYYKNLFDFVKIINTIFLAEMQKIKEVVMILLYIIIHITLYTLIYNVTESSMYTYYFLWIIILEVLLIIWKIVLTPATLAGNNLLKKTLLQNILIIFWKGSIIYIFSLGVKYFIFGL